MKCMKCGTGVSAGRVFCEECLADMAQHPVKPNTPLLLPHREKNTVVKRSRFKIRKPEEIIHRQRRFIGALLILVVALSMAFAISIYMLMQPAGSNPSDNQPGQNYGTSTPVG
ncbi:MAG: hypothetical protein IKY59_05435 [Oscillospiraceae bacterium]|nr:hypothetical protein [Oscillospiraceae bacterium]